MPIGGGEGLGAISPAPEGFDAGRQGSTELLAQHFTGWLGETIDQAFVDPRQALPAFESIISNVERVVDQRGLKRSLNDYREQELDGEVGTIEAFNSGSFHGVVAVARAVQNEFQRQGQDTQLGAQVDKKCQGVARSLLLLDFEASSTIAHEEPVDHPDVDSKIEQSYMAGVESTLDGIVATVRARLQRRLASLFESPELLPAEERLATLLLVALTNHPLSRIVKLLGERYRELTEEEQRVGNIENAIAQSNPPLTLTDRGRREVRSLLLDKRAA